MIRCVQNESESKPGTFYLTILYSDGSTSCNCFGWCRRKIRDCKHVRNMAATCGLLVFDKVVSENFGAVPRPLKTGRVFSLDL